MTKYHHTPGHERCRRAIDNLPARASRALRGLGLLCGLAVFGVCGAGQPGVSNSPVAVAVAALNPEEQRMWMTVGERRFAITLADTEAARALRAMLPLSIDMANLNANEKHADLPKALPARPARPGTIHQGDLMLYGSRTLVVFYQTFDSAYSYTRLGSVDDPASLARALGSGSVRITFSRE